MLALRGRVLPDTHTIVAAALQIEGLSLMDLGRILEAEPLLHESLALRQRALPAGHWLIAASESSLGACLVAAHRFREAEPLLLHGYEGLRASRGDAHERTIEARLRIQSLYEAWGKSGRAAAFRVDNR